MVLDRTPASNIQSIAGYKIGDEDYSRGWGGYTVTAVGVTRNGDEFCEKDLTIKPAQVLSLQSHDHRGEEWTVLEGILTVILNAQYLTLHEGDSVKIPQGSLHTMANLSLAPVRVHEIQIGKCSEDDIHRFKDIYGREAEKSDHPDIKESLKLFDGILAEIKKLQSL